jgi:hypothetical protein
VKARTLDNNPQHFTLAHDSNLIIDSIKYYEFLYTGGGIFLQIPFPIVLTSIYLTAREL